VAAWSRKRRRTTTRSSLSRLIARLRQAIAIEEEDDHEQLNAVLRMLGAETPDKSLPGE
jgi:hypothetical protein